MRPRRWTATPQISRPCLQFINYSLDRKKRTQLPQTCDVIVVSLDTDSVKQADAPGCSAPYPNGLTSNDVEEIARVAGDEPKVKLFSIYEVSPPYDRDNQTAALAASAIWNFIFSRPLLAEQ